MSEIKVGDWMLVESSFSSTISIGDSENKSMSQVPIKEVGFILNPGKYCVIPTDVDANQISAFTANSRAMHAGLSADIMSISGKLNVRLYNMNHNHSVRIQRGVTIGEYYSDHGEHC